MTNEVIPTAQTRLIKEKISMLTKDFKIKLSFEDIQALSSARDDMQLDRIAHDIFMSNL